MTNRTVMTVPEVRSSYCSECGWHRDICICKDNDSEREAGRKSAGLLKHIERKK